MSALQSPIKSCLMFAIIDRSTGNFIHNADQYPRLYYDHAHANRECVRLRRSFLGMLQVIRCRLVEDTTLTKSSAVENKRENR